MARVSVVLRAALVLVALALVIARCDKSSPPPPTGPGGGGDSIPGPGPSPGPGPGPGPGPDPGAPVLIGAGDIARCDRDGDEQTARLLDNVAGTVITLGDAAYNSGTLEEYTQCYGPSWGKHRSRTRPAAGERDYGALGADPSGYFDYWGERAGERNKGYYSYDIGDGWHVVVLNSNLDAFVGSPQEQWLRADLAANTRRCIAAYWHHPLFYSGGTTGSRGKMRPLWDALYAAGAALVINAHNRNYERFAPQRPDGTADPEHGIRQFIVGTGGASLANFGALAPNSEVQNNTAFGVLKVTLGAEKYDWEFVPATAGGFTDSGSGVCPEAAPLPPDTVPTAHPGGPYTGSEGALVVFNGNASTNPTGGALTYAWQFGDGAAGTGAYPTHAYADNGTYTVTLTVTSAQGTASPPVTTTATIANAAPIVTVAGDSTTVTAGASVTVNASFSDFGAADAPWSYEINWGDGTAQTTGTLTTPSAPIAASHLFAVPGTYQVRVTVRDKDGGAGADSLTVRVVAAGGGDAGLARAGEGAQRQRPNGNPTAPLLDRIEGAASTAGGPIEAEAVPGTRLEMVRKQRRRALASPRETAPA